MSAPPANWWIGSKATEGIPDMQAAYSGIFGQGMWIIVGSLVAFLVSQLVDVFVFQKIKKVTGEKNLVKSYRFYTNISVDRQFCSTHHCI
jgi:uncharacterized integral membrane protein (TIGR00697 family)